MMAATRKVKKSSLMTMMKKNMVKKAKNLTMMKKMVIYSLFTNC